MLRGPGSPVIFELDKEAVMLKSGVILFFLSIVGMGLRFTEFDVFASLTFKLICSLTLTGSISCLLGTYCIAEFVHARTPRK